MEWSQRSEVSAVAFNVQDYPSVRQVNVSVLLLFRDTEKCPTSLSSDFGLTVAQVRPTLPFSFQSESPRGRSLMMARKSTSICPSQPLLPHSIPTWLDGVRATPANDRLMSRRCGGNEGKETRIHRFLPLCGRVVSVFGQGVIECLVLSTSTSNK